MNTQKETGFNHLRGNLPGLWKYRYSTMQALYRGDFEPDHEDMRRTLIEELKALNQEIEPLERAQPSLPYPEECLGLDPYEDYEYLDDPFYESDPRYFELDPRLPQL